MFDIGGLKKQFTWDCEDVLASVVETHMTEGMMVCEVGSWTGASTAVIASIIKPVGGRVHCVDWWQGSHGTDLELYAMEHDIFNVFKENMKQLGLHNVYPHVMTSIEFARVVGNKTFDMVFIDADHRYKCVKEDILAWLPKVKDGGIMAGHDCDCWYDELPPHPAVTPDADYCKIPFRTAAGLNLPGFHLGVIAAVSEIFDKQRVGIKNTVWWTMV